MKHTTMFAFMLLPAVLFATAVALGQPAPKPVPQPAPEAPPAAQAPQRLSSEVEVLAMRLRDVFGQQVNAEIELNKLQRAIMAICKAHPDIEECKAAK